MSPRFVRSVRGITVRAHRKRASEGRFGPVSHRFGHGAIIDAPEPRAPPAVPRGARASRDGAARKVVTAHKMLPVKGGGVVDPESGQLEQCEDGVMFIGGNVIRGREAKPPRTSARARADPHDGAHERARTRCRSARAGAAGSAFEAVIAGATMVTSALYHLCESIERPVLGMNAGNWHRLDNVFAIMGFVATRALLG